VEEAIGLLGPGEARAPVTARRAGQNQGQFGHHLFVRLLQGVNRHGNGTVGHYEAMRRRH
jgi:hypothetical protein